MSGAEEPFQDFVGYRIGPEGPYVSPAEYGRVDDVLRLR